MRIILDVLWAKFCDGNDKVTVMAGSVYILFIARRRPNSRIVQSDSDRNEGLQHPVYRPVQWLRGVVHHGCELG